MKILVVAHKPDLVYKDDIFMPIQVGKANAKVDLGFQSDDTGDNISTKNPNYCELTALYWAWKNLHDVEYIGLCHYRRYFDFSTHGYSMRWIKKDNLEAFGKQNTKLLLSKVDKMSKDEIILPRFWSVPHSVIEDFQTTVCWQDIEILMRVIRKLYPDYMPETEHYLLSNYRTGFNMFVMNRHLLNNYAQWLFSILEEVELHIKLSPYTVYRRVFGYMGEWLLPIYCMHNHLKISQTRVCTVGNFERRTTYGQKFVKNKLCNMEFLLYRRLNKLPINSDFWDDYLKTDGIIL